MDDLLIFFFVILGIAIFLVVITLVGHLIWVTIAWLLRQIFKRQAPAESNVQQPTILPKCPNCNFTFVTQADFCGHCGAPRPSGIVSELLKDLAATVRQIQRFRRSGVIDEITHERLMQQLETERSRLTNRGTTAPSPAPQRQAEIVVSPAPPIDEPGPDREPVPVQPAAVVTASLTATEDAIVIEPDPIPAHVWANDKPAPKPRPSFADGASAARRPGPPPPLPRARKPFSEVLAAFMEQSNIRWGEIIGGLLIIGCSTALVVSLWAQISSIPVLKFLIFTSVTAALFGIGLYTEHRWKLPTTSRGILTIATLLVPLNFLAIAAVSGGTGIMVIGGELFALAVFLCLVYFAGRVLTPKWAHLLTAAVLGPSVGQLLIRHFATPDYTPGLLLILGVFPIACYVATTAWKLRIAMADEVIDETETNAIFITLGAATFAALLPFGLLLYKSGPVSMSMMYLAPLVTLGGVPLLASGALLWRRVRAKELVASRTAGTSLAVIGTMVVLSGMILAWPNPASIVPAALFNFAVFTALAVLLELPVAHLFAAGCLALAYLVLFHVVLGHVPWQNLRIASLFDVMNSVSTGQVLAPLFVLLLGTSEWLTKRKRTADGKWYLVASCAMAVVSLWFVTSRGFGLSGDPDRIWFFCLLYATAGCWIAWRRQAVAFAWIGSLLLLLSLTQAMGQWLEIELPWNAALLGHATVCAVAAVVFARYQRTQKALSRPLNISALLTSVIAIPTLMVGALWEPTAMLAQDLFWLAGVWLVMLWLDRNRSLFMAFQIALTVALVVAAKASLQQYDWYTWHGSLHPWSLQIQGIALLLLSLGWVALRFLLSDKLKFVEQTAENEPLETQTHQAAATSQHWLKDAQRLLNAPVSFDRFVTWSILAGFVIFTFYGALSGVQQELTARGSSTPVWDVGGFPHQYALGLASWPLLGLLLIAMLANMWQRRRAVYILGALGALATICPLIAGRWETQVATASAWRFTAAAFLVLASLPLWFRERLSPTNFSLSWGGERGNPRDDQKQPGLRDARDMSDAVGQRQAKAYRTLAERSRVVLLTATLVPLLLLTAYPALRAIFYLPVHGPTVGVFYWLGDRFSYGIPITIAALALIVYAVRERLVTYAFFAGVLFNLTVTMAYLLSVVSVHGSMDRVVLARVVQLNAITTAVYAIVWLSWRRQWLRKLDERLSAKAEELLKLQVIIAVAANAFVILPVALRLAEEPGRVGVGTFAAGSGTGWLAFAFTTLAVVWFAALYRRTIRAFALGSFLFGAGCLAAFTVARWNPAPWSGFHALLSAAAAVAWLMCLSRALPSLVERGALGPLSELSERLGTLQFAKNWPRETSLGATVMGALAVLLSLRGVIEDPTGSWWSISVLFLLSALAAALNWQTLQRAYLYAAGLLFSLGTSIWWLNHWDILEKSATRFFEINVFALCLSSLVWLALELRARRLLQSHRSAAASFHNVAALLSLLIMSLIALLRLLPYFFAGPPLRATGSAWLALSALFVLMTACLWDRYAKYAVAGLYLTGLVAAATLLSRLNLSPTRLGWAVMMVLAIYAIATSLLWRRRERLISWATQLKIPSRLQPEVRQLQWLVFFNVAAIVAVTILAYWIDLRFAQWTLRITAALAVGTQAFTFVLLAPKTARQDWQRVAFIFLALGAVFFGWAWLVPGVTGTWLNRAVILMVEMFAIVSLFGLELDKALEREPEWTRAVRDCVPYLALTGVVALFFILGTEVSFQIRFGLVRIALVPLVTVAITLASATVICVLFALSPNHDPLNLPEKHRRNYVYVAELMLGLLFMHIRLTMPWLFTGFFERYWPLVVVALAYLGVTASELLRRRGVFVLAHPLQRTGAFLPLLPVLGFWLTEPHVDYSALLFVIGGLYGLLAILRRSFGFGVMAALAANGGLWYLWHRTSDYTFLQHPQLWLIPAACSVLIAVYLNREDFSEEQMVGLRYSALVTIYASSTADIFINGVANSPWLPMILAALALGGVLCGMIFRIRAFLMLGSIFLLLAIVTMIRYAHVNFGWTWLWWVAGIITGMMIIATFAVFEKKREEMLRVVEGMKEWQP